MPPIEDANLELTPSDSPVLNDVVAATENIDTATPADSSAAPGATEDTLSIVRDVVDEARKSDATSPVEGQDAGATPASDATKKEPDDENFSDVPFHKHPRFQKLLGRAKAAEVDAGRYQNVQKFLDSHGLAAEETAEGLIVMGLAKTNPAAAWERIKPWVQSLLHAAGEVLPNDLAERVKAGQMTQEVAFEVSRNRAQLNSVKASQSFAEKKAQTDAERERGQALFTTANDWESDRIAKDPNYEAKRQPLREKLAYLQSIEGKPNTPEGVRAQLKKAYDAVSVAVPAAPVNRPRPVARPAMSGQVSGQPQPKPQSTLEIIRANRARQ